jgi:hypothetical protein
MREYPARQLGTDTFETGDIEMTRRSLQSHDASIRIQCLGHDPHFSCTLKPMIGVIVKIGQHRRE